MNISVSDDLLLNVASKAAEAELKYGKTQYFSDILSKKFFDIMSEKYFLPNSPILVNINNRYAKLSASYVLPIDLKSIDKILKIASTIYESGGGIGFNFSKLRWNEIISTLEKINKEARNPLYWRGGANMGILNIDHPDIFEFIGAKVDTNKLNNFNLSINISDNFIEKVINKDEKSQKLFKKIVDNAWQNGEPGLLFIDRINENNPTYNLGRINATDTCGEIPLLPNESCILGAINLSKFVEKKTIKWNLLKEVVLLSIHFLDNIISINRYPNSQIKANTLKTRKIGLGIMGLADMLSKMELLYNSNEGIKLASQIVEFINYYSKVKSVELAQERGAFPAFKDSIYNSDNYFLSKYQNQSKIITKKQWEDLDKNIASFGIRNATTTAIAPAGTIAKLANTSFGIEPFFEVPNQKGINKKFYPTACDISPKWHIKMQSALQTHIDNAISKTVNLPETATKKEIEEIFLYAYKKKLKGVTVYRNNSRKIQHINLKQPQKMI